MWGTYLVTIFKMAWMGVGFHRRLPPLPRLSFIMHLISFYEAKQIHVTRAFQIGGSLFRTKYYDSLPTSIQTKPQVKDFTYDSAPVQHYRSLNLHQRTGKVL